MVGEDSLLVGVVGGAGPEASNRFCEILIHNTTSHRDQDNIAFIHFCNPKIPDRTEFLLERGEDPVPAIVASCRLLESAGADFLVIPCNTAHAFLRRIREKISAPLVDMVGLVARAIKSATPEIARVGILATSGSIKTGLHRGYLDREGIAAIIPSEVDQEQLVMTAIYGTNGIKAGGKRLPKRLLLESAARLVALGAEAIVLGCTEISLVLSQLDTDIRLYDPMRIAADAIIKALQSKDARVQGIDSISGLLCERNHLTKQSLGGV